MYMTYIAETKATSLGPYDDQKYNCWQPKYHFHKVEVCRVYLFLTDERLWNFRSNEDGGLFRCFEQQGPGL